MIYSSGTTGQPKGVRFPLKFAPPGDVSDLYKTRIKMHQLGPAVRYLSTAPMYHSAPLRYNMMVTRLGGTAYILEKFDAEAALAAIQQFAITHSQWVPTMFVRLLKLAESTRLGYDVSSLQYVIHAAAPCPIEIKQQMIDWLGPVIYEYYSGTEANGSTAITTEEWLKHKGSVGKAIHGEIHILDDDGLEQPPLQPGTVYFANGSDFHYHKDPEKTRLAKNDQGWSTLGDIGYLDEAGYLYLQDRKSFMIISGGVNIYPQEIENLLITHPAVSDVAVFGVPNAEFGEEVKAVVELLPETAASPQLGTELLSFCRDRLSHIKCPRTIDFTPQLPRHPTGKLYKRQLRAQYWP
jgi:acyl-CoA synthetase (AMP-forming)/AMP-acid ligase II